MTGIARLLHTQQAHYVRRRVNYNDAGVAAGVLVGTVPGGSLIINGYARVIVVFNAVTTNVLTVGTNSTTYNNIFASGDITPGTLGGYATAVAKCAAIAIPDATDTDIFATYTQTGTAATTGQVDIAVAYIPNNDG